VELVEVVGGQVWGYALPPLLVPLNPSMSEAQWSVTESV